MKDYKHLAKVTTTNKHRIMVVRFTIVILALLYTYAAFDVLSGWVARLHVYIQSDPIALFPVILITLAIVVLGGGIAGDIIMSYLRKKDTHKKGRGMATMQ